MFTNANGESAVEVAELHVNACSPNLSLPLAPADYASGTKLRRLTVSANSPARIRAKHQLSQILHGVRRFYNAGDFGAYKMPFADVIDGRPYAVPAALEAINAESVAESDRQRIIANVDHYKSKMEKTIPNSKLAQFLNWIGKKFGVNKWNIIVKAESTTSNIKRSIR